MEYRNWYWIPSNTHPTSLHDHGWCAAVPAMPRAYVGDVKLFRSAAYEDLAPADVKPRSRGAQGLRKKGCQKGIEVWKLMKQTEKIQSNLMYTIFMYINMIYIYMTYHGLILWYVHAALTFPLSPSPQVSNLFAVLGQPGHHVREPNCWKRTRRPMSCLCLPLVLQHKCEGFAVIACLSSVKCIVHNELKLRPCSLDA